MQGMVIEQVSFRTQVNRHGGLFDTLAAETLGELMQMARVRTHEAGETLFCETDESDFVYIVLEGRVKLTVNSMGGRRLILGHAGIGEIVGVASALCGQPHETTAEVVYTSRLGAIGRDNFLNFLLTHPDVYRVVGEELGRELHKACEQLRTVVLSTTAPQKLARLLLEWGKDGQSTEFGARFRFCMTHEELGECIGASRETVTRVMTTFKTRKLVMLNGSTLTIPNTMALENFACARSAAS